MISLDEEYLGYDANEVVVRALKVCAGIVGIVANGGVVGVHFSNSVSPAEILVGMTYVYNHWISPNGGLTSMYLVYNANDWARRNDRYGNPYTLVTSLKMMWHYNGQLGVYNKNLIAASVDLRLRDNVPTPMHVQYRVTPVNDDNNRTLSPNINVRKVHAETLPGGARSHNPLVRNLPYRFYNHYVSNTTGGWIPFAPNSMMML